MIKFKHKLTLACSLFLGTAQLNAMQFNGIDLNRNSLMQNNFEITADYSEEKPANLTFRIENNKINFGVLESEFQNIANKITNDFTSMLTDSINGGGLILSSSLNLTSKRCQPGLQIAKKSISLQSESIEDNLAFILAPEVNIKTDKIKGLYFFGGEYTYPNLNETVGGNLDKLTLEINPNVKTANHKIESITFYKSQKFNTKYSLFGNVQFDFSNLNGSSIFMVGADKITFKFNKDAF